MEIVKHFFGLFCRGIKEFLWGICLLPNFLIPQKETDSSQQQQSVQRLSSRKDSPQGSASYILLQCVIFGVLFWFSNFIYTDYILNILFVRFVAYMEEDLNSVVWLQNILYCVFFLSWVFPLLLLSKILNFFWYQDIADLTFKKSGIRKSANINLSEFYADQIKSFILQVLYCVQGFIVYLLPLPLLIQNSWYIFHLSLLSSLYAFEYKWVYIGWPLQRRLSTIDKKWPYFLGFGLPIALVSTCIASFINSMILFAILFPICVISSTVIFDSQSPTFSRPFHSFKVADFFSDAVVSFCLKISLGSRTQSR